MYNAYNDSHSPTDARSSPTLTGPVTHIRCCIPLPLNPPTASIPKSTPTTRHRLDLEPIPPHTGFMSLNHLSALLPRFLRRRSQKTFVPSRFRFWARTTWFESLGIERVDLFLSDVGDLGLRGGGSG